MYKKAVHSLVAIVSILMALVLGITWRTSWSSSTTPGPAAELEYVPEHNCPASAIKRLQKKYGAELVRYGLQNRKELAEPNVQPERMECLLIEVIATPGSHLNDTLMMQMMLRDHQVQGQTKELQAIFNCPKRDPLSFRICDQLSKTRVQYLTMLSNLYEIAMVHQHV